MAKKDIAADTKKFDNLESQKIQGVNKLTDVVGLLNALKAGADSETGQDKSDIEGWIGEIVTLLDDSLDQINAATGENYTNS